MRLFVGVELDAPLRAACAGVAAELQERLQRSRVRLPVRWVPEQNLHITLWFLGEVPEERAAVIADGLRAEFDLEPFPITVSGAGAFPESGPPRIVWLGIGNGADRMAALHRQLGVRLLPLGFEPEARPYRPHITIGRVKVGEHPGSRTRAETRRLLRDADAEPGGCHVRAVTVFASRLSPGGARYEPLLRVPLKGC